MTIDRLMGLEGAPLRAVSSGRVVTDPHLRAKRNIIANHSHRNTEPCRVGRKRTPIPPYALAPFLTPAP